MEYWSSSLSSIYRLFTQGSIEDETLEERNISSSTNNNCNNYLNSAAVQSTFTDDLRVGVVVGNTASISKTHQHRRQSDEKSWAGGEGGENQNQQLMTSSLQQNEAFYRRARRPPPPVVLVLDVDHTLLRHPLGSKFVATRLSNYHTQLQRVKEAIEGAAHNQEEEAISTMNGDGDDEDAAAAALQAALRGLEIAKNELRACFYGGCGGGVDKDGVALDGDDAEEEMQTNNNNNSKHNKLFIEVFLQRVAGVMDHMGATASVDTTTTHQIRIASFAERSFQDTLFPSSPSPFLLLNHHRSSSSPVQSVNTIYTSNSSSQQHCFRSGDSPPAGAGQILYTSNSSSQQHCFQSGDSPPAGAGQIQSSSSRSRSSSSLQAGPTNLNQQPSPASLLQQHRDSFRHHNQTSASPSAAPPSPRQQHCNDGLSGGSSSQRRGMRLGTPPTPNTTKHVVGGGGASRRLQHNNQHHTYQSTNYDDVDNQYQRLLGGSGGPSTPPLSPRRFQGSNIIRSPPSLSIYNNNFNTAAANSHCGTCEGAPYLPAPPSTSGSALMGYVCGDGNISCDHNDNAATTTTTTATTTFQFPDVSLLQAYGNVSGGMTTTTTPDHLYIPAAAVTFNNSNNNSIPEDHTNMDSSYLDLCILKQQQHQEYLIQRGHRTNSNSGDFFADGETHTGKLAGEEEEDVVDRVRDMLQDCDTSIDASIEMVELETDKMMIKILLSAANLITSTAAPSPTSPQQSVGEHSNKRGWELRRQSSVGTNARVAAAISSTMSSSSQQQHIAPTTCASAISTNPNNYNNGKVVLSNTRGGTVEERRRAERATAELLRATPRSRRLLSQHRHSQIPLVHDDGASTNSPTSPRRRNSKRQNQNQDVVDVGVVSGDVCGSGDDNDRSSAMLIHRVQSTLTTSPNKGHPFSGVGELFCSEDGNFMCGDDLGVVGGGVSEEEEELLPMYTLTPWKKHSPLLHNTSSLFSQRSQNNQQQQQNTSSATMKLMRQRGQKQQRGEGVGVGGRGRGTARSANNTYHPSLVPSLATPAAAASSPFLFGVDSFLRHQRSVRRRSSFQRPRLVHPATMKRENDDVDDVGVGRGNKNNDLSLLDTTGTSVQSALNDGEDAPPHCDRVDDSNCIPPVLLLSTPSTPAHGKPLLSGLLATTTALRGGGEMLLLDCSADSCYQQQHPPTSILDENVVTAHGLGFGAGGQFYSTYADDRDEDRMMMYTGFGDHPTPTSSSMAPPRRGGLLVSTLWGGGFDASDFCVNEDEEQEEIIYDHHRSRLNDSCCPPFVGRTSSLLTKLTTPSQQHQYYLTEFLSAPQTPPPSVLTTHQPTTTSIPPLHPTIGPSTVTRGGGGVLPSPQRNRSISHSGGSHIVFGCTTPLPRFGGPQSNIPPKARKHSLTNNNHHRSTMSLSPSVSLSSYPLVAVGASVAEEGEGADMQLGSSFNNLHGNSGSSFLFSSSITGLPNGINNNNTNESFGSVGSSSTSRNQSFWENSATKHHHPQLPPPLLSPPTTSILHRSSSRHLRPRAVSYLLDDSPLSVPAIVENGNVASKNTTTMMFRRREVPQHQNHHFISAAAQGSGGVWVTGGGSGVCVVPPKLHSPRPIHYNQSAAAINVAATATTTTPTTAAMTRPPPLSSGGASSTIHRTLGSSFDCYNPTGTTQVTTASWCGDTTLINASFSSAKSTFLASSSTTASYMSQVPPSTGRNIGTGLDSRLQESHHLSLSPSAYPASKILAAGADYSPMLLSSDQTTTATNNNKGSLPLPSSSSSLLTKTSTTSTINEMAVDKKELEREESSSAYFYSAATAAPVHTSTSALGGEGAPTTTAVSHTHPRTYLTTHPPRSSSFSMEADAAVDGRMMLDEEEHHHPQYPNPGTHSVNTAAPSPPGCYSSWQSIPVPTTPSPAASSLQSPQPQQYYINNTSCRRTAADDVLDLLDSILDVDRLYLTRYTTVEIPSNKEAAAEGDAEGGYGELAAGGAATNADGNHKDVDKVAGNRNTTTTSCQLALRHFTCWKDPSHDNKNPHLLELLARCHADKEGDFSPQQVILIDDDPNNVRAARQWGLQASRIIIGSRRRSKKKNEPAKKKNGRNGVSGGANYRGCEDGGVLCGESSMSLCPTTCSSSGSDDVDDDDVWGTGSSAGCCDSGSSSEEEGYRELSDTQKMANVNTIAPITTSSPILVNPQPPLVSPSQLQNNNTPQLSSFKAFCCSGTGLSRAWYASQPHLQELLGVYVWEPCFDGCV